MAFQFPPSSSSPSGQTSSCSSTFFGTPIGRGNSSSFGGIQATTISPPSFSKLFRGSAVHFYTATREINGNGGKIQSISVMPIYQYKSHEELRLEDYELKQNRENAVEESKTNVNPPFGAEFGSIGGSNNVLFGSRKPMFGVSNAQPFAPLSSSSTWSTFGAQSFSGGLSSSGFKTCDNQAKLFQSTTANSQFHPKSQPLATNNSTNCFSSSNPFSSQAPTAPPLWSTSPSEKNTIIGVQSSSGGQTPPFCFNACTANSQPEQTTNSLSQPSQASNGSTMITEVGSQTNNGQQYVPPSSTVCMQSASPFDIRYEIDGPNAVITIRHGTSSIGVSGKISSLTINSHGIFHETTIFRGSSSNIARATPEIDANSSGEIESISATPICKDKSHEELRSEDYHELHGGKSCEGKACPSASFKLTIDETEVSDDTSDEDEDDDAALQKREADVLALMPKLPDGDYYTEPCIKDLAAKEMAEPGFCSRVNDRAKA